MVKHVKSIHSIFDKFQCKDCEKTYKYKQDLERHRYVHLDQGFVTTFVCLICKSTFKDKRYLKQHEFRVHKIGKRINCDRCDKKFKRNYDLKIHLQYHLNEKNFTCSCCQKSFNAKKDLNNHQKMCKNQ